MPFIVATADDAWLLNVAGKLEAASLSVELGDVLIRGVRVFASLHVVPVDEVVNTLLYSPTVRHEPGSQLAHHLTDKFLMRQLLFGLHDADDGCLDQVASLVIDALVGRFQLQLFHGPQRNVDVDPCLPVLVVLEEVADGVQWKRQL